MISIAARMAKVSPSATLKLTSKAKEMKAKGFPVINFGAGEPDFDTPQVLKDEAVKWLAAGFTKYTPTSGIPELVIHFIKEAIEVLDHSNLGKHTMHDIFPPLFLMVRRQGPGVLKLADEGGLNLRR